MAMSPGLAHSGYMGEPLSTTAAEQHDLSRRIRGEYREMPGLRLTLAQASRLWQMPAAVCEALLEELVREAFLYKADNNTYVAWSTLRGKQAKAHLGPRVSMPRSA